MSGYGNVLRATGGEAVTKRKPLAFMQYVLPVWLKRFPGSAPPPGAATALKPVYDAVGDEEATARLRRYLGDVPPKYINLMKFAATHSAYAESEYRAPPRDGRKGGIATLSEVVKRIKFEPQPEWEVEEDPATGRLRRKP